MSMVLAYLEISPTISLYRKIQALRTKSTLIGYSLLTVPQSIPFRHNEYVMLIGSTHGDANSAKFTSGKPRSRETRNNSLILRVTTRSTPQLTDSRVAAAILEASKLVHNFTRFPDGYHVRDFSVNTCHEKYT